MALFTAYEVEVLNGGVWQYLHTRVTANRDRLLKIIENEMYEQSIKNWRLVPSVWQP